MELFLSAIVSDHDATFACVNVRISRFKPRYKFIRQEKNLDEVAFEEEFSSLPLNVIYGLESPDDMFDSISALIKECIVRHVPLRRVNVTRLPAPWIQSVEIRQLQNERDRYELKLVKKNNESWSAFRAVRNKIKTMISKARRSFLENALSSKRLKEVWQVIHRVLYPNPRPLRVYPGYLNKYFVSTAERTLGNKPDDTLDLLNLVQSLSASSEQSSYFSLVHLTREEVLKEISQLR